MDKTKKKTREYNKPHMRHLLQRKNKLHKAEIIVQKGNQSRKLKETTP